MERSDKRASALRAKHVLEDCSTIKVFERKL